MDSAGRPQLALLPLDRCERLSGPIEQPKRPKGARQHPRYRRQIQMWACEQWMQRRLMMQKTTL